VDESARHLRLLTETIAAVNSTLDLEEVLSLVARGVADALGAERLGDLARDELEHLLQVERRVDRGDRLRQEP
jgi:hypothetical protein